MDPLPVSGPKPEEKIVKALMKLMRERKWWVHKTHGGAYSSGLPDLIAYHRNYGFRLIEVKNADSYHFTTRQEIEFGEMLKLGVPIHVYAIPAAFTERQLIYEYEKTIVNGPPNWTHFLGHSKKPF